MVLAVGCKTMGQDGLRHQGKAAIADCVDTLVSKARNKQSDALHQLFDNLMTLLRYKF
jgi:hypothetical protein